VTDASPSLAEPELRTSSTWQVFFDLSSSSFTRVGSVTFLGEKREYHRGKGSAFFAVVPFLPLRGQLIFLSCFRHLWPAFSDVCKVKTST